MFNIVYVIGFISTLTMIDISLIGETFIAYIGIVLFNNRKCIGTSENDMIMIIFCPHLVTYTIG